MSQAFERWTPVPAPIKELRRAEFRLYESEQKETMLRVGVASEASPDHPERNEDSYYVSEGRGVDAVFDGVGGGLAGNLASARAAQELTLERLSTRDAVTRHVMEAGREEPMAMAAMVENAIEQTLNNMQAAVAKLQTEPEIITMALKAAEQRYKRKLDPNDPMDRRHVIDIARSMSCTASLSKIWRDAEGKDWNTIGHVGDSRIYRLRNGRLERMTPDHSIVQAIIDHRLPDASGVPIEDDQDIERVIKKETVEKYAGKDRVLIALKSLFKGSKKEQLSLEEIRHYVLQTVGVPEDNKYYLGKTLEPFIKTETLKDGDAFLECSDGLSDVLTDDEMRAILMRHLEHPLEAAKALQTAAAERSKTDHIRAKPDDVTALVQRFQKKTNQT